jgi:dTMP kinase
MKFFVIEGLDASGKSTQLRLLQKYLKTIKVKFKFLHFPRTNVPIYGELIARFLRGDFGDINFVNPYLVALIYAGDRKDASELIQSWLNQDYLVITDRYVYSNIAFQCAKLNNIKERKALKNWINHLEYNYNKIPKPDLGLFLDVPFEFTKQKLCQDRKGDDRAYLKGQKDIHEHNLKFQQRVRDTYLWLVKEEPDFQLITCKDKNNKILPQESIFQSILNKLSLD